MLSDRIRKLILSAAVVAALGLGTATFTFAGRAPVRGDVVLAGESPEALLAILKRADAPLNEKFDACRQLAVVGDKSIVPAVAPLLLDPQLSHMARYALEPIADPSVDDALRDALGKSQGRMKAGIAHSLGMRRDARAVPALAAMLADADPLVAGAAAGALGRIADDAAVKALTDAVAAAPAKAHLWEGLLGAAENRLLAGSNDAAALFDKLRAAAAPQQIRPGGLRGAVLARGAAGVPLIVDALKGDDPFAANGALRVVVELKGADATRAIAAALPNLSPERQVLLVKALGNRGDAAAAPAVLELARSGPPVARVPAIRALAQLPDPAAVPFLLETAAGEAADAAEAARAVLSALPGANIDAAIADALQRSEGKYRLTALELAGRRRVVAAVPALVKLADGSTASDDATRRAAVKALGDMAGPAELPTLLGVVGKASVGGDLDTAEAALQTALGRSADRDAAASAVIAAMPAAPDADHRKVLLRSLRAAGSPKALAAVRDALKDDALRDTAIRTLGDWPDPLAVADDLLAVAKSATNDTHRLLALRGYVRPIGQRNTPIDRKVAMAREALAAAKTPADKRLALGAAGQVQTTDTLAMLLPYLDDASVQNEAATAILNVGEKLAKSHPNAVHPAANAVAQKTKAKPLSDRAKKLASETAPRN